jgi:hypothetical protein
LLCQGTTTCHIDKQFDPLILTSQIRKKTNGSGELGPPIIKICSNANIRSWAFGKFSRVKGGKFPQEDHKIVTRFSSRLAICSCQSVFRVRSRAGSIANHADIFDSIPSNTWKWRDIAFKKSNDTIFPDATMIFVASLYLTQKLTVSKTNQKNFTLWRSHNNWFIHRSVEKPH